MESSNPESHPRADESSTYHTERDPTTQVLKTDYSLITIQPGVVLGRYIAVLGGLDTKGTEGATMFVTSRPGIEKLSKAIAAFGESERKGRDTCISSLGARAP